MLFLLISIALVYASLTYDLAILPADLILPIVSHIGTYRELVAFNITSKTIFPLIRPIFDFTTACQVHLFEVWPNRKLLIETDSIFDKDTCATHLMQYSSLYKKVRMRGNPSSVTALLALILTPIQPPIDISFLKGSLNTQLLKEFINSIKFGLVTLYLDGQTITQEIVNLFAISLDRRSTTNNPFFGLGFNLENQQVPINTFESFFRALAHSDLKTLTLDERLYKNALAQLAEVLPQSKLTTFGYYMSKTKPEAAEMEALGSALVRTPTMKKISILFPRDFSSDLFMKSMAAGLGKSNLVELQIINGINMDTSIALIKKLPRTLRIFEFSCGNLNAFTIVNLLGVVAKSNVQELDLSFNHLTLSPMDIGNIRDSIEASQLKVFALVDNRIAVEEKLLLSKAVTNSLGQMVDISL